MSWNTLRLWFKTPLFYYNVAGIGILCGGFYLYHLERVPVSGRWRFNIVSAHWEEQLGKALYREHLEQYGEKIMPSTSQEYVTVKRIFDGLVVHSSLPGEDWDINVIDEDSTTAYVLPGGKVFIHSGLLDFCKRSDELAMVLGHEIAHNVAHHASESVSRALIYVPLFLISCFVTGIDPDLVEGGMDVAFRLPKMREQEREADRLGMLIVARSGYDPSTAIELWSRWEDFDDDESPNYLSTHPSHHDRFSHFALWLREAREERLTADGTEREFDDRYHLQRAFCGIERELPYEVVREQNLQKQSAPYRNPHEQAFKHQNLSAPQELRTNYVALLEPK